MYNARLLDGNAYMTSRQWIVSSRWDHGLYPPAAQKKLGSPWVGPQQVVRQATGHTVGTERTGHSYCIHTRGWFENLSRPGERWLNSWTVDSEVIVCEYSGISSGICCQWLRLNPISDCIYLRQCISYAHAFCHSMQFRWPHWRSLTSRTISYHHSLWGTYITKDADSTQLYI